MKKAHIGPTEKPFQSHMITYAEKHLRHQLDVHIIENYLNSKNAVWKKVLNHQIEPMDTSLHLFDTSSTAEAVKIHKNIMDFMGDSITYTTVSCTIPKELIKERDHFREMTFANHVIQKGFEYPGLRDEIYLMLVKQTSNNPKRRSRLQGWKLICYCCAVFPPSREFEGYISYYLMQNSGTIDPLEVGKLATLGETYLGKTMSSPSQFRLGDQLDLQNLPVFKDVEDTLSTISFLVDDIEEREDKKRFYQAPEEDVHVGESIGIMSLMPDSIGYQDAVELDQGELREETSDFRYQQMGE